MNEETKGYKVIIAGYSSAAYLTTILSMKLDNVVRSIAFGPIFDITQFIDKNGKYWKNIQRDFLEFKDTSKKKYFDITHLIKTKKPRSFLYFYANGYYLDKEQHNLLIKSNIILDGVGIDSTTHCGIFNKKINIFLLTCSEKKFVAFKNKFAGKTNVKEKEVLNFINIKLNLFFKCLELRLCKL